MKCPFTKSIETMKTQGTIGNNPFIDTIHTNIKFGECEKSECPYYNIISNECRRTYK